MKTRIPKSIALGTLSFAALASTVLAQKFPEEPGGPLPSYALRIELTNKSAPPILAGNGLPTILITGYWPPTNEMLRQFSTNPEQNPGVWVGEDWEGRGYNIYAFFPEFPDGVGQGEGDFEVDYQDTSADWWRIVPPMNPIALVTFSRASFDHDWTVEGGNRTYAAAAWIADFMAPTRPTPELPIMIEEPPLTERQSSQPMQRIVDAVNQEVPALNAHITPIDNSRYLSNFIGYHGNWYHDLHADPDDPLWTTTGGHIHVGYAMDLADAVHATEVTLRTLITHVNEQRAMLIRASAPHDILKNRYISIDPRGASGNNPSNLHIRVMVDSSLVSGLNGTGPWWASAPDADCISVVTTTKPASEPDWSGCPVVHLTGCPIIPTTTYAIVAESGGDLSGVALLDTQAKPGDRWWGDVVGTYDAVADEWLAPNGTTNIDDAVAAIKTFQNPSLVGPGCGSPPCNATHVSVTDVQPHGDPGNPFGAPNGIVNINDVFGIILGFQGVEFPGPAIEMCP